MYAFTCVCVCVTTSDNDIPAEVIQELLQILIHENRYVTSLSLCSCVAYFFHLQVEGGGERTVCVSLFLRDKCGVCTQTMICEMSARKS